MVAAIAGGVASILGISTTAATIATSVALYAGTAALQYYYQKSQLDDPEPNGSRLQIEMGGAIPQSINFGDVEKAGQLYYAGTWGRNGKTPNAFLVQAFIMGDLPGGAERDTIWVDGQKCSIDLAASGWTGGDGSSSGWNMGHPVTTLRKNGRDYKWVKQYDGSQTSADPYLLGKFGLLAKRPYTSGMVGYGRQLVIITTRLDKEEGGSISEHQQLLQGSFFYDPRKDSTNGGSGSHRWGVRSTYEFTRNAPVIYYNVRRGIYYGGKRLYGGKDYSAYMLDNDTYFAAMNTADENISLASGGTEKRYTVGGEMDLTRPPIDLLNDLLACMNGRVVEDGGVSKLYCGAIGASVYSFTDDDILWTSPEDGSLIPQPDNVFNTVGGAYTEADDGGQLVAYRKKASADALTRDGEEILKRVDFAFIRSNTRAQRCAKFIAKEGQRWRTHSHVLPPQARKLRPCDVVSWTSPARGYSSKKFECGDVIPLRDGNVFVQLREVDASDIDWSTADELAYTVGDYDRVYPATQVYSATVSAVSITDDDNTTARRPAVRIQADVNADDVDCIALVYQVRKRNGDRKIIHRGRSTTFFDPNSADYGDITFTDASFLPARQVQVRYKVEGSDGRKTDWNDDWTTTTNFITLTNAKIIGDEIGDGEVNTKQITIKAISDAKGKSGQAIHSLKNAAARTGDKGNDTLASFTIQNQAGSAIILGIHGVLSVGFSFIGATAGTGAKIFAKGTLSITQKIGSGPAKIVKQVKLDAGKKLKKNAQSAYQNVNMHDFVVIGDGSSQDITITATWAYEIKCLAAGGSGFTNSCVASVSAFEITAFYSKR